MTRKEFMMFISSFDLSRTKIYKIFETYSNEDFSFATVNYSDFIHIVGNDKVKPIQENANETYLKNYIDLLENNQIKLISREDEEFPNKLKRLRDCPYFLFCKGNLSLLNKDSIAIIGTRATSNYGSIVTERFAGALAQSGLVVVSGLAYGVDSISHRKTLAVGGETIAVLGGGLLKIYPSEHTDLAREIAEKGLLVSEYSPKMTPTKFTFPNRNRIVAGLSDAVLITEASIKSGTMITKDHAIDNGIPVYAVPGNILSDKSEGTNMLIRSGQAICVTDPEDIVKDLGHEIVVKQKQLNLHPDEQKIVDLLASGEKNIEYLRENSGLDINNLNSLLVSLEIRDIIKRMLGDYYALV